ncbi:DUF5606 domain-containing protein [Agriterribacter sp.]|uniref:DUF5606 family protein n=1 Tax=Agriterribacter sp. TaxID=2821509 RepID=UPI002BDCAC5A|nr:DUF5606 domain-containing protein [Agriterribacter sp.]HTN05302.1 DUF5606 domain-containing protein [Agriterribacter sp.]
MEYSKIISVTGLGGLFELLSSKGDGAIVRSLEDKSTRFVSSRVHNFSHLESIEIFTVRDNVNLADVFLAMQKDATPLPGEKDNAAVKKYFETVYPDMDFERVYTSDMKKMVKWLSILTANNIDIKAPQPEEEEIVDSEDQQEAEAVKAAAPGEAAPQKSEKKKEVTKEEEAKPAPKAKAAPKKAETTKEEEAVPKKKATPKKKAKE